MEKTIQLLKELATCAENVRLLEHGVGQCDRRELYMIIKEFGKDAEKALEEIVAESLLKMFEGMNQND